jgi:tetratricopeptide (TPR) repeat protein
MTNGITSEQGRNLSAARKFLLSMIAFGIFISLIIISEVAVRFTLAQKLPNDPKMAFAGYRPFFTPITIKGRRYYKVTHPEMYRARDIAFSAKKDPNTLRIFCLGSSASAGWPHPPSEIYSEYLRLALQRIFPRQHIEILNVSAHAWALYRTRLIFNEVVNYEPDLLIVYAGNNEFLERRTYLPSWRSLDRVTEILNRSALFRLGRVALVRLLLPEGTLSASARERKNYDQWSKVQQMSIQLRKDPRQFEQVKAHFAFCVESIAKGAAEKGVPIVWVTVPVNLRDWRPNASYNLLSGETLRRWQETYRAGRRALLLDNPAEAVRYFKAAIDLEPQHADSYFFLARAYENTDQAREAVENYSLARDMDHNPFRAISDFNMTIRSTAAKYSNVHLADADEAFLKMSAPRAPGFKLFLDYVHPNYTGNLCIARVVYATILQNSLLGAPAGDKSFSFIPQEQYSEKDELRDLKLQKTLFWLFALMHQHESLVDKARYFAEARAEDLPFKKDALMPENWPSLANVLKLFSEYGELERRKIIGDPVDPEDEARMNNAFHGFYEQQFHQGKID